MEKTKNNLHRSKRRHERKEGVRSQPKHESQDRQGWQWQIED